MPWYKITLPVDRVAAGEGIRLMNEIDKVFIGAGYPRDAAVYGDLNAKPEATHFFNPTASEVAQALLEKWGGVECEDPGEPVALLIGRQEAYFTQNKSQRR